MGIVHTDSSKSNAKGLAFSFAYESHQIDLLNSSISFLLSNERKLYNWVGASTYAEFMDKIRALIATSEQDREAFKNFKKANLNKLISAAAPGSNVAMNKQVVITCTPMKYKGIKKIFDQLNMTTKDFTIQTKGELTIGFEYNAHNIKRALNALNKKQDGTFGAFKPDSENMAAVNNMLNNLITSGQIGSIVLHENNTTTEITELFTPQETNIFGYKKPLIEKALKSSSDNKLREKLLQTRENVYNVLLGLCNGSKDVEDVFKIVWGQKVGFGNSDSEIMKFLFLSKGDNLEGAAGAIQEMATAMITLYLAKKIDKGIHNKVVKILGDIIKENGEPPKTDVEIMHRLGIQVKAYNQNSLRNIQGKATMDTNIHPSGLDAGLAGFNLNIGDAMVQACFNSSNDITAEEFSALIERYALAQALSLQTSDNRITDSVSFYFLDAQYLVPGSALLLQLTTVHPQVSIRQPEAVGDDTFFRESTYKARTTSWGRPTEHDAPEFVHYFNGDPLEATSLNIETYDDLYTHSISIDVEFEYNFMYDSYYAIYR